MKTIYRIAKTELSTLFYSPIAWFILIVFAFQTGMSYLDILEQIVRYKSIGYTILYSVTAGLYTGYTGLFTIVQSYLYLYIPLLTMSLFSREFSSGSIKLLFSSPVTATQIVLGKYLSMMLYGLVIISILGLTVLFSAINVENFDIPVALSGLLGIYLLICSYAAIGLFMSALTSYQVVAAVGTLAVLAVLNFVGGVAQDIEFVREITYWFSIRGRSDELISGLICSEDVIYFIVVIALFVAFTIYTIQSGRKRCSVGIKAARYSLTVVLAVFVGYISSRPSFMSYYDTTNTKSMTLTTKSQEIMKSLTGGLTITTYVNLLDKNCWDALPSNILSDAKIFKQYVRFKPEIKLKYVYYYDKAQNESLYERYLGKSDEYIARDIAKKYNLDFETFLSPADIKKELDLSAEENRFVRVLERESGEKSYLRVFEDMMKQPRESEISASLKRLITKVPKVAFLTGHQERELDRKGDGDYYSFTKSLTFRYSLINQGFDLITLNLDSCKIIPSDVSILVIADPKTEIRREVLEKINTYILNGGNLLIATDAGNAKFISPIIEKFGVTYQDGFLAQVSKDFSPVLITSVPTDSASIVSTSFSVIKAKGQKITMPGAVALKRSLNTGYSVLPLLTTQSKGAWVELEKGDINSANIAFDPSKKEVEGSYVTAYAAYKRINNISQRVIILGDADCFSNSELLMDRSGIKASNFSLITESFKWLSNGEFPVSTKRPLPNDRVLTIETESLFYIKLLFMVFIPLLITISSILIWLIRRRR